jgi:exopolysaccharide biosynthesis operon protein EpsL
MPALVLSRAWRGPVLAACLCAAAAPAYAIWGDRLELVGIETLGADSNIFRLSSGSDPATAIGSPSRGDTYRITSLGLNLNVPVSRQRFAASYATNEVRYRRFRELNFDGYDGQALWHWQLGNQTSGRVGASESYSLAALSNFQTRIPNPLKVRQTFIDGTHLLTPSWRVGLGLNRLRQENGDPARRTEDVEVTTASATLAFLSRAGNSLGALLAVDEGRFPSAQVVDGAAVDNAYTQRSAALFVDWTPTGKSHLYARAGLVKRSYAQVPGRDFDDGAYQLAYEWKATGKLTLVALARREISPLEDIRTSFVRVTGVALRPTLELTAKTSVSASLERSTRDFFGDPRLGLGLIPGRRDRVRAATLALTYRPVRAATLFFSVQRETRSSTIDFGDYAATVVRASVRLAF